jgi:hypothetical protein
MYTQRYRTQPWTDHRYSYTYREVGISYTTDTTPRADFRRTTACDHISHMVYLAPLCECTCALWTSGPVTIFSTVYYLQPQSARETSALHSPGVHRRDRPHSARSLLAPGVCLLPESACSTLSRFGALLAPIARLATRPQLRLPRTLRNLCAHDLLECAQAEDAVARAVGGALG